jgi:hypothetical protein
MLGLVVADGWEPEVLAKFLGEFQAIEKVLDVILGDINFFTPGYP